MDTAEAYERMFFDILPQGLDDMKVVERKILYGVRMFDGRKRGKSYKELELMFQTAEHVMTLMTLITARQFVELFPIQKVFDGAKYECKDYFSTIEMINEHGWDELISDPNDFIWDYHNEHLRDFMVMYMSTASDLMRMNGHPGILESWAAENNVPLYTMHTDYSGKQYMMDSNGRTAPVVEHKRRHLKVVKKGG